jgi:hypothetical protein
LKLFKNEIRPRTEQLIGCEGSSQGRNAASRMLGRKGTPQRVFPTRHWTAEA